MLARTRRQVSMMRRIAQALNYLRGEARAAALDEVAAAICQAERSVSTHFPEAPPPVSDEADKPAPMTIDQDLIKQIASPRAPT